MISGFVLGKFLPLHKGHLALIDFAKSNCDLLYVILCFTDNEEIDRHTREKWLAEELKSRENTRLISFSYSDEQLPNTSVSSRTVARQWAHEIKKIVPDARVVFSSEPYGDYLAEYMNIRHIKFDEGRKQFPVSGTSIRNNPLQNWDYLTDSAKPWYVKKIVLLGSESTGKSELTQKLAAQFHTVFVPEMARDVIGKTNECTYENLEEIALRHAGEINQQVKQATRLLFIDTDIHITQSYSRFLFNRELAVSNSIKEANRADLYFFLETDCPFIQDGTRVDELQRENLSRCHKEELKRNDVRYITLDGNWDNRFQKAVKIINDTFF